MGKKIVAKIGMQSVREMWNGFWSPSTLSDLAEWLIERIQNPIVGLNGAVVINFNVHTPEQEVVDMLPSGKYYLPYFYAPAWGFIKELVEPVLTGYTMVTYDATRKILAEPMWFEEDVTAESVKKKIQTKIAVMKNL